MGSVLTAELTKPSEKIDTTPIKQQKKSFWYLLKKYRVLTLMALPAMIYFFVNNYIPMFGLFIAFKKINFMQGIFGSPWCGFQNFKYLFATPDAMIITRNTICYNLVFIVVGTILSVLLAILLNELGGKMLPKFYQTSIIIPAMVSMTVIGYVVYAFLSPDYGVLNRLLKSLGCGTVNWYLDAKPWPLILPIVNVWKGTGYGSIIYLASIVGIDNTLYEAAIIDGAGRWQKIRYVTLPMLKPVIITLVLLSVGKIFYADFGLFYQVPLASGAISRTTEVIDTYVYKALMTTGDLGMSSAAGFYQSIVGFVLVLLSNLAVRKISNENALF